MMPLTWAVRVGGVVPVREGDLEALAGNTVGEHVTLDHGADVNTAVTALLGVGARSNEALLLTTPGAEDDGVLELHVVVTRSGGRSPRERRCRCRRRWHLGRARCRRRS